MWHFWFKNYPRPLQPASGLKSNFWFLPLAFKPFSLGIISLTAQMTTSLSDLRTTNSHTQYTSTYAIEIIYSTLHNVGLQ